jgi:dUTPase
MTKIKIDKIDESAEKVTFESGTHVVRLSEDVAIQAGGIKLVSTGLSFTLPKEVKIQATILPHVAQESNISISTGIVTLEGGELIIPIRNHNMSVKVLRKGEALAGITLVPNIALEIEEVKKPEPKPTLPDRKLQVLKPDTKDE